MTKEQAQQIIKMRKEGIGYKSIGIKLNLSRDIVRNFCKSRGLAGYGKVIKKEAIENDIMFRRCLLCGLEISQPQTGRKKKFCNIECRRKWWSYNSNKIRRNENAIYKFVCLHCKNEFESYGNKNRKYCSHDCYIRHRFWTDASFEG